MLSTVPEETGPQPGKGCREGEISQPRFSYDGVTDSYAEHPPPDEPVPPPYPDKK